MYLEFLKAYRAWLDAGAPNRQPFLRRAGLCPNLHFFTFDNGIDLQTAEKRLTARLNRCFGNSYYPFTDGSPLGYLREMQAESAYLNPKRIAFVDAEIKRLEKQ